jgi:hypothetical protein
MTRKTVLLLSAAFTLAVVLSTRADSIIYDATAPTGILSFTAEQNGDEVQAAGTDRTVTQMQIGMSMQGYSGTADIVLRLYANDGAAGAPVDLAPGTALESLIEFPNFRVSANSQVL